MLSFLHHPKTNAAHIDASFNSNANRGPKYVLMLLLPFFAILAQMPFTAVCGQASINLKSVTPDSVCTLGLGPTTFTDLFLAVTATGFNATNDFNVRIDTSGGDFSNAFLFKKITDEQNIPFGIVISGVTYDSGDYIIRVDATDPVAVSDTVRLHITNGNNLDPHLTLSTRDVSGCGGGSDGIITGVVTGGIDPFAFYFVDKQLITTPITGDVVDNLAPGTYGMVVRDAVGCEVGAADSLIQIPVPSIEVSTKADVSACGSHNGLFTLRVFPRTGIYATAIKPFSFQEVREGQDTTGVAYVEKPVPVTFSNLTKGKYKVSMKDGAGCVSNFLQNIEIKKDTALILKLGGWGNPTTCTGNDGDITVLATNGSHSTYRYSLKKHGDTSYGPEQSGRRFGGLEAGTYIIKGRDSRGCFDTLHKTLNDPKGCSPAIAGSTDNLSVTAKNALRLQVLPNPTRTTFTLNLQGSSQGRVQIIVTDMFGKKLYQTTGSSSRQYTFGSEFKSGVYIVQVIQGKQIQTIKLVKEN